MSLDAFLRRCNEISPYEAIREELDNPGRVRELTEELVDHIFISEVPIQGKRVLKLPEKYEIIMYSTGGQEIDNFVLECEKVIAVVKGAVFKGGSLASKSDVLLFTNREKYARL